MLRPLVVDVWVGVWGVARLGHAASWGLPALRPQACRAADVREGRERRAPPARATHSTHRHAHARMHASILPRFARCVPRRTSTSGGAWWGWTLGRERGWTPPWRASSTTTSSRSRSSRGGAGCRCLFVAGVFGGGEGQRGGIFDTYLLKKQIIQRWAALCGGLWSCAAVAALPPTGLQCCPSFCACLRSARSVRWRAICCRWRVLVRPADTPCSICSMNRLPRGPCPCSAPVVASQLLLVDEVLRAGMNMRRQ